MRSRCPACHELRSHNQKGWVYHGQGDRPIASDFGSGFDYAGIVLDVVTPLKSTFQEVTSPLAAR